MEPFKNVFHRAGISTLAAVLARQDNGFSAERFIALATRDLEALELKQRSDQICEALAACLPQDFPAATSVIAEALHPCCDADPQREGTTDAGVQGWLVMPLADYVGRYGVNDLELAMLMMRLLTMRFTAEYGIRHLLLADLPKGLRIMQTWTSDQNEHVRRLASEGARPRLPWGLQLTELVKNPALTLPLLESLRDDPSEYVRRSVANHLNDHSKLHPHFLLDVADAWRCDGLAHRRKLLRHALRNLLKQGAPQALQLFGMKAPVVCDAQLTILTTTVELGGELQFELSLRSDASAEQKIRLDIVIHYQKANGSLSPKTFMWKEIVLAAGAEHRARRKQSFRPITTRVYHRGLHRLEVKANGLSLGDGEFLLR